VTFTSVPPTHAAVGGAPYTVNATGGASGNPVDFSSESPSVCTVSGSSVSFVGPGSCEIQAEQAGNAEYLPGYARQAFSVSAGPCGGSVTRCFTSNSWYPATAGSYFSFTVKTSGTPAPTITEHGNLPSGVKFHKGTGSASISGTPRATKKAQRAASAQVYRITFTATYGKGTAKHVVTQAFSLTVAP
jgi:hypothetical protein